MAAVALANKNARIAWASLAHDRQFDAGYDTKRSSDLVRVGGNNNVRGEQTTDCSGVMEVMAKTGQTVVGKARAGRGTPECV